MNEVLEQPKPRADIIAVLRQLAARGTTVRELTGEIRRRLGCENEAIVPVLWYLTEAFGLTLPEVLPVREWIGTDRDEEIDALIMPAIANTREKWANAVTEQVNSDNGEGDGQKSHQERAEEMTP